MASRTNGKSRRYWTHRCTVEQSASKSDGKDTVVSLPKLGNHWKMSKTPQTESTISSLAIPTNQVFANGPSTSPVVLRILAAPPDLALPILLPKLDGSLCSALWELRLRRGGGDVTVWSQFSLSLASAVYQLCFAQLVFDHLESRNALFNLLDWLVSSSRSRIIKLASPA